MKVKLFRHHPEYQHFDEYDDEYKNHRQMIVDSVSEWEEVSDDDYKHLQAWVTQHHGYLLISPVDSGVLRQTITEQINIVNERERIEAERLRISKEQEKKRKEILKAKNAEKALDKEKRALERSQKKIQELEELMQSKIKNKTTILKGVSG